MAKNKTPTAKSLARKPRGFPDKREDVLKAELEMIGRVSSVYHLWGFEGVETGAFEYADALGKFLPDQDRPNAGVFSVQDDDEQWMSLRYDLTAPLARFAAEHWDTLPKPFRRYAYGPVWRNEKPGPGRFREFMQCDADTVGAAGPGADAEMIVMMAEALKAAGAADGRFAVRVNTRQIMSGLLDLIDARSEDMRLTILRALDKLDRLGIEGVADLLGEGREDESGDYTKGAGLDRVRIDRVLAFAQAGRPTRGETLEALASVVSGSEIADQGIAELREIDRLIAALGAGTAMWFLTRRLCAGLSIIPALYLKVNCWTKSLMKRDVRSASVLSAAVAGMMASCRAFAVRTFRQQACRSASADWQRPCP